MKNKKTKFQNIAFFASDHPDAVEAAQKLSDIYGDVPTEEADAIVALGGDGLMLQTLHRFMQSKIPIYGMNRGSVGFLMNEFQDNRLIDRLENAKALIEGVEWCDNAHDAVRDADALLVLTEWNEFRALDLGELRQAMSGDALVDLRNIFNPEDATSAGFRYCGIGL